MTTKTPDKKGIPSFWVVLITAALTLLIGSGGAYLLGYLETSHKTAEKTIPEKEERKVAYWRAPMNPTEVYDQPGKSVMGMDLVPVYEDELVDGVDVRIDPVVQQNMGIRTARVEKAPLVRTIRTYGNITYDETRTAEISPKVSGWIEKIHVDFTGKFVEKGQPLFELYSPELFSAQQEYLAAYLNFTRDGRKNLDLLESARERLRYFDIPESAIRTMEKSGKLKKTLTLRSPFNGVVIQKNAEAGTYIRTGTTVYRIADLSRIWVEAHIYEYELPWVSQGQEAEMTLPYLPGRTYSGKVSFVYPYLQQKTRDVVVRLEFDNPNFTLKPDMYCDIIIKSDQGEGIVVPSEAVIRSGERNVAFVVRENNKFEPRDLTLGLQMNTEFQVLSGLAPGDVIVTSGQFLIDSESNLTEAVQKMMEPKRAGINAAEKPEEDVAEPTEGEADILNAQEQSHD